MALSKISSLMGTGRMFQNQGVLLRVPEGIKDKETNLIFRLCLGKT